MMIYSKKYQMLACNTDINDNVSVSSIFGYMQDAACGNMAEGRPSYRELYDMGYSFVLSRITVNFYGSLSAFDNINVESWAVPSKGYTFGRDFRITKDNKTVAEAVSEWALVGVSDRKLHRVGEIPTSYGEYNPLDLKITRFRIDESNLEKCREHTVAYADCDLNGHMNNARYPDLFLGCVGDMRGKTAESITIYYLSEAPLGCTLTLMRCSDGNTHYIRSVRDDGKINAECSVIIR